MGIDYYTDEYVVNHILKKNKLYCPFKYKHELVHFLVKYQGWLYSDAIKLRKKQLCTIYYDGFNHYSF